MPLKNAASEKLKIEFTKMQKNLFNILQCNDSKFSFAVDAWTAKNGRSYYGITIHFIDKNWRMQSVALDLIPSYGRHTGTDIAKLFYKAIQNYNIETKIQGITLDNVSANKTFIYEFGKILKNQNIYFDVENQHFRCFAHILNLGVQDVLKLIKIVVDEDAQLAVHDTGNTEEDNEVDDEYEDEEYSRGSDNSEESNEIIESLKKVRSLCKKLHYSEQLTNQLKLCCATASIEFKKVVLDVRTRWDSTHDMLSVFFKLKKAIILMFDVNLDMKKFKLKESEWFLLEEIYKFLYRFKYISKILSSENSCTLPEVVVMFNLLVDKIEETTFTLNDKTERTKNDEILIRAFQAGRDKIIKHYDNKNWMYSVSLILDPRHKIAAFENSTWGKDLKDASVKIFTDIYYNNYFTEEDKNEPPVKKPRVESEYFLDVGSIYVDEASSKFSNSRSKELDEYLEAPRVTRNTDILEWWQKHDSIYPSLARMARDVLSTLASSVPIERFFSTGSLTMTAKRTRLGDESLKSLMCINSWFKSHLHQQICEI